MVAARHSRKISLGVITMLACLLWVSDARAVTQSDVFNSYCVSRVDITAPQSSLDALTIDPKGAYQPATMIVNVCGTDTLPVKNITFRLKGSGSFQQLSGKAAFKIKMSTPNRIDGLKSLTLNNMVQDESMIHEALAYKAFAAVGVPAPRAGYAIVSITNSDTGALVDYGLHANIESLDDRFMNARFGAGTWGHLWEAPSWTDFDATGRDILPGNEPHFELEETGAGASTTDFAEYAAISTIAGDSEWWTAIQQKTDMQTMLRLLAAELYIGDWDGFGQSVNNYYPHSTLAGVFGVIPTGKDQTFVTVLGLDPDGATEQVFNRCLHVAECQTAFRVARNYVAETIIGLDLVDEAHHLEYSIASAVAADTRMSPSAEDQCDAANDTVTFLVDRETLWSNNFRLPGSGITSKQTSEQIECDDDGPVDPWTPPVPPETTGPTGSAPVETPPARAPAAGAVSINAGAKYTKSRTVKLTFSWPDAASSVEVSNDPQFAAAQTFGRSAAITWTLPKAPRSSNWRMVHVRFAGGATASDGISVDDDAPTIKSLKIRASQKTGRYSLTVRARSGGSGNESVQIKTPGHRKPLTQAYGSAIHFSTRASKVRIRVIDRAGNASDWQTLRL
jgi:hypothetical protein